MTKDDHVDHVADGVGSSQAVSDHSLTTASRSPEAIDRIHFTRSYAKINLTLDVLQKRPDGYHELATIMQTIDLYDTLCFSLLDEDRVSMVCNRPELSNEQNLVVRAAQAIRQKLGLTQGLTIELNKRIPVAAGLGGGSSNAAATLLALQQWWQLPLSMHDLWEMASALGSDVPFFLSGGLALCEGRGERITPLAPHWPAAMRWLLLLKPAIGVSTATVFRKLTATDHSNGSWSQAAQTALQTKSELLPTDLYNGLERGVLEQYSEVAQARAAMLQAGAHFVRLSGSGPTLFTTFATLPEAAKTQYQLQKQGYEVYLTRAITTDNTEIAYF
ncbi:4-(cytidine 5'-diphospho)-2-C-methyl-D-erythritol kinase [Dictyobacter kobayashii]|uniref:4-diphosphocytidyl-2-C-methyl-D-erythritol kinase n=1 Tax=Dictyobacter kobayashii TaxID=2014872 RepID=A0A402AMD2_9CHLR|nr:4-(cytidine 5'-diphospho)-2-C-methyl-D-erythritol kinase [Dictyobacter kobayashii]GCE20195.1 4-diphosphocytidyl-2-C-methyl-D-erythritol kinase [Dictyobacter kobayashii]